MDLRLFADLCGDLRRFCEIFAPVWAVDFNEIQLLIPNFEKKYLDHRNPAPFQPLEAAVATKSFRS